MMADWRGEHLIRITKDERIINTRIRNALAAKVKGVLKRTDEEKAQNFKIARMVRVK